MANQFNFIRVDNFLDDMNREECFDTQDMDGVSPNFKFVLASECSPNIEDCLDEDGTLKMPYDASTKTGVTLIETEGVDDGYCSLLWNKGINGERNIGLADSTVSYDLGEDPVSIKGIFLVAISNGTGYVLAYCILDKALEKDGTLILPCQGSLWSIRYGV